MCETDDRLVTWIELFLYFTNDANLMTQQLLLATFIQHHGVIHQPNFESREKNGGHLYFRNVYP